MTLKFDADLFRIVFAAASTEETRYYLNGVNVEPHPSGVGVILVATDGHRLIAAYDETGTADAPAIIRLDKAALRLCKAERDQTRTIIVEGSDARIMDAPTGDEHGREIGLAYDVVIYGTFPDWRRVLPAPAADNKRVNDAFDSSLLAAMAAAGADFLASKARQDNVRGRVTAPAMRVVSTMVGSPALICWRGVDNAFGVLMPMRSDVPDALPPFMAAPAPVAAKVEVAA
jgi:hypothetical protein